MKSSTYDERFRRKGHAFWRSKAAMKTRFGPHRPAADTERIGEHDFWVCYEDFSKNFEDVRRFFEALWRNLLFVKVKNFHQLETNKENELVPCEKMMNFNSKESLSIWSILQ